MIDHTPMAHDTKVLVCEGPCNAGAVAGFDAAVDGVSRLHTQAHDGAPPLSATLVPLGWLERARQFVYTVHWFVSRTRERGSWKFRYACATCGTTRVYGCDE